MKDIHDILRIKANNLSPSRGRILISEPFLYDFFFKRSVVLLAEHNEEGTFGVIVNKPLKAKFNDVIKDFPKFTSKVYLGGPVQNDSLFFIHTKGEEIEGSAEILPGLYWGGDIERVKDMISLKTLGPEEIRFYIGYSGWAPKQLQEELERNSWAVSSMGVKQLLQAKPAKLWTMSLEQLGEDYTHWSNFPDDPTLN
jgi:putative transcriptional regulator